MVSIHSVIYSTEKACEICSRQLNSSNIPAGSSSSHHQQQYQQQGGGTSSGQASTLTDKYNSRQYKPLSNSFASSTPTSTSSSISSSVGDQISTRKRSLTDISSSASPLNPFSNAAQSVSEPSLASSTTTTPAVTTTSLSSSSLSPTPYNTTVSALSKPSVIRVKTEDGGSMTIYESTQHQIDKLFQRQQYRSYLFSAMEMNDGLIDNSGKQRKINPSVPQPVLSQPAVATPIFRNQLPLGSELNDLIRKNALNSDAYFVKNMNACDRLNCMRISADIQNLRVRKYRYEAVMSFINFINLKQIS